MGPQHINYQVMLRTKKSVTPITMSMMFTVAADDAQRRIGNHHINILDDDVVQCLSTPYGAPEYRQRAETLIEDIKLLLLASDLERSCSYSEDDFIKRLQIVDSIECLGIDRHFQPQIKLAIDYVYRCWNERGIGVGSRDSLINDVNATALGFRALRLHRYNVSSAVFENFKDENGKFISGSIDEEGYHKYVRCMLSLLRASNISYPGETVMEEAKSFATNYLKQVLAGRKAIGPVDQNLLEEVNYALEFPWHCSPPRLEARSFIEIYGQNDSWLKSNMNKFLLELAKLDFNILQCTHQKEIQIISRWFTDIAHLNFHRKFYVVEPYFWVVTGMFEPEFCGSRIAFTKLITLMTLLDDLYDTHGKLEQLKIFTEGVRRWDLSLIESLPCSIKTTFEFFFKTSNELIAEVEKDQGRDMAAYIRKNAWERYLGSYLQEAEWIASGHVPTFDEYMKNGTGSSGFCVLSLIPLLLMGQRLPQDILEKIYSPSRFQQLLEFVARLVDDARDFQIDMDGGNLSCIECYLKDHPECTVEDALNHVNGLIDISLEEINMEFLLKHGSVPLPCKKYAFNTLAQGTQEVCLQYVSTRHPTDVHRRRWFPHFEQGDQGSTTQSSF